MVVLIEIKKKNLSYDQKTMFFWQRNSFVSDIYIYYNWSETSLSAISPIGPFDRNEFYRKKKNNKK